MKHATTQGDWIAAAIHNPVVQVLLGVIALVIVAAILIAVIKSAQEKARKKRFKFATGVDASEDQAANITAIEEAEVQVPTDVRDTRRKIRRLLLEVSVQRKALRTLKKRQALLPQVAEEFDVEGDLVGEPDPDAVPEPT